MHVRIQSIATCGLLALGWLGAAGANAAQAEASFTSANRYDAGGQLVGAIAPDPDGAGPLRLLARRFTYAQGLLVSVETGELTGWPDETVAPADWGAYGFAGSNIFQTHEITHDSYGRKTADSLRNANGSIESLTQYSYDEIGRVECITVRMNAAAFVSLPMSACTLGAEGVYGPDRIYRYTYDALDQVLTEHRAYGTELQQTYVVNTYSGRLLRSQTDANGNRTELEYDSYGRLLRRLYPSPTTRGQANSSDYNEYSYQRNGNLLTERKRSGAVITYAYDQNNRRTDKMLSDRTYSDDVRYDYDLRGLTRATYFAVNPELGVFNEFDGFGRVRSATSSVRMDSATASRTLNYEYDADSNRTRITHPDGVYFEYTFDGLNRVSDVLENGSSTLLTVTYGPDGQRQNLLRPAAASTSYDFDDVGRLRTFTQQFTGTTHDLTNTFAYNPASQVTQLTKSNSLYTYTGIADNTGSYAPNGLNQYALIDGRQISYDTNGNLTSDGTLTYSYDMENRLVATSGVAAGLRYDALGHLVEIAVIPGAVTHFLYDGDALVAEYTIAGGTETRTRRYVHGDRTDEPWVQYNGSAVGMNYRRYLHSDHQGSVIAQSDGTGGVLARNAYDAFGVPTLANTGRFGYTGQTWLQELGLNHYKARMYSPRLGRFLQTDPVGYEDDFNLYAYVGNDPLNRADPTGQFAIGIAVPVVIVGALIAGCEATGSCEQLGKLAGDVLEGIRNIPLPSHTIASLPTTIPIAPSLPTVVNNGQSRSADEQRGEEQRERRRERRESESRQGPDGAKDQAGNPQKLSGEGFRDKESANQGPQGERQKGPDRSSNRERNVGIDEEHSMKPKGGLRQR